MTWKPRKMRAEDRRIMRMLARRAAAERRYLRDADIARRRRAIEAARKNQLVLWD